MLFILVLFRMGRKRIRFVIVFRFRT